MMPAPEAGDLIGAALGYARRGWAVFPLHSVAGGHCSCVAGASCENAGKHPRTHHGFKEASLDEGTIVRWWTTWPNANIGIATGSGLLVLDVDPRHDGTTEGRDLPDTLRCVTGSGGEHWYYRCLGPVPCSTELVGPGLDIRADGGYVVAPPSSHESGQSYRWDAGAPEAIAEAPTWLLVAARLRQQHHAGAAPALADAFLAGARNDSLTRLGGSMRRHGFGERAIRAALLEENSARCRPPMDEREVVAIARSMSRYEPGDPVRAASGVATLTGVDLAEPLPPIPWVARALELAPGPVTLFAGRGYSGKTVALQSLALSIASGKMIWGALPVDRSLPVMHLDFEQGRYLTQMRYQRLAGAMDIDLAELGARLSVQVFPNLYLDKSESWPLLEQMTSGIGFCFIDAFRGAFPSVDENSSEVRRHLDMFARVSERNGCCFGLAHHARKQNENDKGNPEQTIRGSSAIFDACQSVLILEANKGEPTAVHHEKARITGRARDDFRLSIEDVAGASVDPEDDGREIATGSLRVRMLGTDERDPDDIMRDALLARLRQHPGLSLRQWIRPVKGRDATKVELAKGLVHDGAVEEAPREAKGGGRAYQVVSTQQTETGRWANDV